MVREKLTKTNKKKEKKNEETEKELEKKNDDEPSWYHYLIVILIFIGILYGVYFGIKIFYVKNYAQNTGLVLVKYPYKLGNATYNLYFHSSIKELENMNFSLELDKYDLLNTATFRFAFGNYTGTDNGEVAKGSTMLLSFLKNVYKYKFNESSFKRIKQLNCSNSTLSNKVVIFDLNNESKEGIFYNRKTGCINITTYNASHMINLVDKLIYNTITE